MPGHFWSFPAKKQPVFKIIVLKSENKTEKFSKKKFRNFSRKYLERKQQNNRFNLQGSALEIFSEKKCKKLWTKSKKNTLYLCNKKYLLKVDRRQTD